MVIVLEGTPDHIQEIITAMLLGVNTAIDISKKLPPNESQSCLKSNARVLEFARIMQDAVNMGRVFEC